MSTAISTDIIHLIVNKSQIPVIFNNLFKNEAYNNTWQLFNWSFEELSQKIGDVKLPFREGVNKKTLKPQWEYTCKTKYMTMKEFLDISKVSNNSNWFYFDYKYMHEWFKDNSEIMKSIDWKALDYDIDSQASTIWIGNKGAHTNCHKDTYGNNLVVQVHGRKQWILFPPNTGNFRETRNPYEESTIYTQLNLFTPTAEEINYLKLLNNRPRIVTLEPGDVLFVPHGWWHFVESLDTSLSVNVWFPLKTDCYDRLSEALVKLIVNQIGCHIPVASEVDKCDLSQSLNFIEQSLNECKLQNDKHEISEDDNLDEHIFKKYPNDVKLVDMVTIDEYNIFLDNRKSRFSQDDTEKYIDLEEQKYELESEIINALCSHKIMKQVVEMLNLKKL